MGRGDIPTRSSMALYHTDASEVRIVRGQGWAASSETPGSLPSEKENLTEDVRNNRARAREPRDPRRAQRAPGSGPRAPGRAGAAGVRHEN